MKDIPIDPKLEHSMMAAFKKHLTENLDPDLVKEVGRWFVTTNRDITTEEWNIIKTSAALARLER